MPAAKKGEYQLLPVRDMEERYKFSSEAPDTVMTEETTGDKVANDLVNAWGGTVAYSEVGGIGVFVCRELDTKDEEGNTIEPATKPGPKELAAARISLEKLCRMRVLEAADWARTGKGRWISDVVHYAAAEYLGETYDWMRPQAQAQVASTGTGNICPVCGASVKSGVFKCASCGDVIDPVGYAAWKEAGRANERARAELVGAKK